MTVELRADGVVDFLARHRLVRDAARRQVRFISNRSGKIAFVRYADQIFTKPESADYFRRRRQKRYDAKIFIHKTILKISRIIAKILIVAPNFERRICFARFNLLKFGVEVFIKYV